MIYAVAIGTSLLFGAPTFAPNRYRYWVRYVGRRGQVVLLLSAQALTYAAAGASVALFANALGVPTVIKKGFLSGFIYGLVPHGLARVSLPGAPSQRLSNRQSPFGRLLWWFRLWLDSLAYTGVREDIRVQDTQALIARTWDLFWNRFYTDDKISRKAKTIQKRELDKAVASVLGGGDTADGLGQLRNFCIGEITRQHDPDH